MDKRLIGIIIGIAGGAIAGGLGVYAYFSLQDTYSPMDLAFLSHPLTILIIGAVLTGLFIPYITNRWQKSQRQVELNREDHKWEIEIKSKIVNRMAQCAMTAIARLEPIEAKICKIGGSNTPDLKKLVRQINKSLEDTEKIYTDNKTQAAVIATELGTYFGPLYKEWDDFYWHRTSQLINKTKKDLEDAEDAKKQNLDFSTKAWEDMYDETINAKHALLEKIRLTTIKNLTNEQEKDNRTKSIMLRWIVSVFRRSSKPEKQ